MVSQALSAYAGQLLGDTTTAERPSLRVRYLNDMRAAPQVLRLADTDERFCAGMQLAYLCSEKRKVRRLPAAGALAGDTGAAEAMAAAFAERQKRCRQTDRGRHEVNTRTNAASLDHHNRTRRRSAAQVLAM